MEVLSQKKYKAYDYVSRYSAFPIYYNNEDEKWESAIPTYLKDNTPYQMYSTGVNESYDAIALKFYNNPTYYWVICSFNHVVDPFEVPAEGTSLKIPVLSNIEFNV